MAEVKLNASEREELGSVAVRRMRSGGIVPGIVYSKGKKSLAVKVDTKDIRAMRKGKLAENVLLILVVKDNKGRELQKSVMIKEMQRDVMKDDLLHIDFNEISMTERLKTKVHLDLVGESKGIAQGGVLDHMMYELEVECFPGDIPEHIIVDITGLEMGYTMYVKDIIMPSKVTLLSNPELPVVSVAVPRAEEEAVPVVEEEGAEGAAAEPEVIGKGKKEEEEEAGAEGKEQGKEEKKEEKKKEEKK